MREDFFLYKNENEIEIKSFVIIVVWGTDNEQNLTTLNLFSYYVQKSLFHVERFDVNSQRFIGLGVIFPCTYTLSTQLVV